MTRNFHDRLSAHLNELPVQRRLREAIPLPDGRISINGRTLIDFSSNDYLGLAHNARVRVAADICDVAAGATASRLITGNHPQHAVIEDKIARLKAMPSALLMTSGFTANSTVLAALLDQRLHGGRPGSRSVRVFVDRLVHASIHFGLAAAGVRQQRFRHNDTVHLEQLLQSSGDEDVCRIIVTESVFSMEGDRADVGELRRLADKYDAMLYIDEAHATGVLGPRGAGLAVADSDPGAAEREVIVGTFGKALGCFGAYVACSETVREYLINRCAGLIYATALPPGLLNSIDVALDAMVAMDNEREHLQSLARRFRVRLSAVDIDTRLSTTQIVPVLLGDDKTTMTAATALQEAGFLVGAIRPPTVPSGTSRLRISFSAAHQVEQVDALAEAIIQVMKCQMTA